MTASPARASGMRSIMGRMPVATAHSIASSVSRALPVRCPVSV
ncbi:hypothetical protein [Streptomyces sp. NPDC002491]